MVKMGLEDLPVAALLASVRTSQDILKSDNFLHKWAFVTTQPLRTAISLGKSIYFYEAEDHFILHSVDTVLCCSITLQPYHEERFVFLELYHRKIDIPLLVLQLLDLKQYHYNQSIVHHEKES